VKTVTLTIDSLKEGVARKGTRATELFIRLKPLFVSGYIKDFKNTINPSEIRILFHESHAEGYA
jgi:hypothetical protein